MPFRVTENEIHLHDHCSIEEAEALHEVVRTIESPLFDLTEVRHLHTAILQLIVASAGTVRAPPDDPVVAACLRRLATV